MAPKWDAKVDDVQPGIVAQLRAYGFGVVLTHRLGAGYPDLNVWRDWGVPVTFLVEVKGDGKKLTEPERGFWFGSKKQPSYTGPGGIVRPASLERWVELARAWPAPWAVAAMRAEFVEAE